MSVALAVFALSAGFCLYTIAGYPLLLSLLVRHKRRGRKKEFQPRSVSVIMPVHNGRHLIGPKLDCLLALDYPRDLVQIIVVSDESTDGTDEVVREYADKHPVTLIRIPRGGKPAGLNAGLAVATGDILFFTDVRQKLERDSLRELVSCFADPEVGVVSGELIIVEGETQGAKDVGLYWKYEKWIRKQLCLIDSFHGATGCIYAMRRELARPLPVSTLNDDMYLPLAAFFSGYRVVFEDNARAYDVPAGLKAEFRRKVRTLAGVFQIVGLMPELIGPRNRMWVHFVSHKLARLLLPYAVIACFVSSFFLPFPWNLLAVGAQVLLFIAAALDPLPGPLKRLSSPARTFVVMMLATLCAAAIFVVPAQSLWKPTEMPAGPEPERRT